MGIALWEVLIAMSLLGVILSSFFCYQINHFKKIHNILFRTIAWIQLDNFNEMLRANDSSLARDRAFFIWNRDNAALLPQGVGQWRLISNHQCHIAINWFEKTEKTKAIDVTC